MSTHPQIQRLREILGNARVQAGASLLAVATYIGVASDWFTRWNWLASNWRWVMSWAHTAVLPIATFAIALWLIWSGIRQVTTAAEKGNTADQKAYDRLLEEIDLNRDIAALVAFGDEKRSVEQQINHLQRQASIFTQKVHQPDPRATNQDFAISIENQVSQITQSLLDLTNSLEKTDRFPVRPFDVPTFHFQEPSVAFDPEQHPTQMNTLKHLAEQIQKAVAEAANHVSKLSVLHHQALRRIRAYAEQKRPS